MIHSGEVREGMKVKDSNGREVGRVAAVGDIHFELEQGLVPIPRHDYLVEFSDVDHVSGDEVHLSRADHPLLTLEVDDDGGALPPRNSRGMDAEPTNVPAPSDEDFVRH